MKGDLNWSSSGSYYWREDTRRHGLNIRLGGFRAIDKTGNGQDKGLGAVEHHREMDCQSRGVALQSKSQFRCSRRLVIFQAICVSGERGDGAAVANGDKSVVAVALWMEGYHASSLPGLEPAPLA